MEKINDNIVFKLFTESFILIPMNIDDNATKLEHAVYKRAGDVALVLYAFVGDDGETLFIHMVSDAELKALGFTEKDFDSVLCDAMNKTAKKFPAVILSNVTRDGVDVLDDTYTKEDILTTLGAAMLTTTRSINGAAALFYPEVREKLINVIGSFYAVFMNTTDVFLYPENTPKYIIKYAIAKAQEGNPYGDRLSALAFYCTPEAIIPKLPDNL